MHPKKIQFSFGVKNEFLYDDFDSKSNDYALKCLNLLQKPQSIGRKHGYSAETVYVYSAENQTGGDFFHPVKV